MILVKEDYKVYNTVKNYLSKRYSQEVLDKYETILGYLVQNNIDLENDLTTEEIDDTLSMFDSIEEIQAMREDMGKDAEINLKKSQRKTNAKDEVYDNGLAKKTVDEEIYSFLKDTAKFVDIETVSGIKTTANNDFDEIVSQTEKMEELFSSTDVLIKNYVEHLIGLNSIKEAIIKVLLKADEEKKVVMFNSFLSLRAMLFSLYIKDTKVAGATNNMSRIDNINDELYGSAGRYDMFNGTFKTLYGKELQTGSMVQDIKIINGMNLSSPLALSKLRSTISNKGSNGGILQDTNKTDDNTDEESFSYLTNFLNGAKSDLEKVRKIVLNILLNGVIDMLCLKHNLNFSKSKLNEAREQRVLSEFQDIMKYCGISQEQLM